MCGADRAGPSLVRAGGRGLVSLSGGPDKSAHLAREPGDGPATGMTGNMMEEASEQWMKRDEMR